MQGAAGFGLPIVVMPPLINLLGVSTASATVALVATAQAPIFVVRYRRDLNIKVMIPLIVTAYLGIPIGVYLVSQVDSDLIVGALGFILLLYALYAWFSPRLPELGHPRPGLICLAFSLGFWPVLTRLSAWPDRLWV